MSATVSTRSKTARTIAGIAAVALIGAGGGFLWHAWVHRDDLPQGLVRANGRLEFTRIDVSVKYPGRVEGLTAHEGDVVPAGTVLAHEEDSEIRAQLAASLAQQAQAEAARGRAASELAARRAAASLARDELAHAVRMRGQSLVSDMEVEQRRTQASADDAAVAAASHAAEEAAHAATAAAAQASRVRATLDDMVIRAPVAGFVEYRIAETGTVVGAGGRVYAMLDPVDPYMTIFLPTATVAKLKVGDEARIALDGLAAPVPARVTFVAPDAQFTPKYVETETERERLVYRVKLTVTQEAQARFGGLLKSGMTGDGYVRTESGVAFPAHLTPG